jgi:hypothetical protein
MVSITDIAPAGTCDTCGGRTDDPHSLVIRAGDNVCGQCAALFTAGHALLDNDVSDEPTILGTLAFAWTSGAWDLDVEDYGGLELLSSVDGVPFLRLPRITADVITYEGSRIPKAVRITVYFRAVKPQELAEVYKKLLKDYGIHFDECYGGSVAWNIEGVNLTLRVHARKELEAWRVPLFKTYPAGHIYAFPPPTLVSDYYHALRGSIDKRTSSGYAHILAESGRYPPLKAVAGSMAWLLGERSNDATPPRVRRPRIAKTLNKHLLALRGEQELLEDSWIPDDTVWRDAGVLRPRLMRVLYVLQEGLKQ